MNDTHWLGDALWALRLAVYHETEAARRGGKCRTSKDLLLRAARFRIWAGKYYREHARIVCMASA